VERTVLDGCGPIPTNSTRISIAENHTDSSKPFQQQTSQPLPHTSLYAPTSCVYRLFSCLFSSLFLPFAFIAVLLRLISTMSCLSITLSDFQSVLTATSTDGMPNELGIELAGFDL
jgi:hypothetical protein